MAKLSALDKAIAVLDGEIAVLQLAKAKLQQQQQGKARLPKLPVQRVRRPSEGGSTDSGNMNYPPA